MTSEDIEQSANPEESTPPTYTADWSNFARRLTLVILLLGLVATAILIRPVLQFVILAVLLVFILSYPVRLVESRTKLSHGASVAIVYLVYLMVAITLFLYLAIPAISSLSRLTSQLNQELPSSVEFLENYEAGQGWLLDPETGEELVNFDFILEPLSRYVKGEEAQEVEEALLTMAEFLTGLVFTVADFVTGSLFVHILAFFFLLELPTLYGNIMGRIPINHQEESQILISQMLKVWGSFFRGTVTSAGLIGLLTFIQLTLMGIPAALTLGLLIFVASLIPMIGGIITLPALIFVTFTQGSTFLSIEPIPLTILVVIIHIVISQVIWSVYYPRQTGKMLKLPVSLIILGLAIGSAVGGFLGILLAVPVLGTVRVIVDFLLEKIRGRNPYREKTVVLDNP